MKVGVCEATELKKRSEMLSIPFADLLWGYAVEDLIHPCQSYESYFQW